MPVTTSETGGLIVKVGGSLYDLPDLGSRLRAWLAGCKGRHVLLVPGGGASADAIRELDRIHNLGEESAHRLALRALTLNAHLLHGLLGSAKIISTSFADCLRTGDAASLSQHLILDAHAFALADEGKSGALPHCWAATSDALAARVALVCRATELVLLKSATIPSDMSWSSAAELGLVDPLFSTLVKDEHGMTVRAVNFREWMPAEGCREAVAPGRVPGQR